MSKHTPSGLITPDRKIIFPKRKWYGIGPKGMFLPVGLPMLHGAAAPAVPPVVTFTAGAVVGPANPTTSGALAIGTAAADRWVYCVATTVSSNAFVSATIGGLAASLIYSACTLERVLFFRALVPTGTTAVVSLNVGGTNTVQFALFTVTGVIAAGATDTQQNDNVFSGSNADMTVNIPDGGFILVGYQHGGTGPGTWTATGWTSQVSNTSNSNTRRHQAGSASGVTPAEPARLIRGALSGATPNQVQAGVISWAPG